MSYRLKTQEALAPGIERIVKGRIDSALRSLNAKGQKLHEGVHDARKRFKEIRAVLRLMRPALGETYRHENVCFRDLGRKLAGARDAQALIETFDKLVRHYPERFEADLSEALRTRLQHRLEAVSQHEQNLDDVIDTVSGELKRARERLAQWPLGEASFDTLGNGLKKIYADGRKRFRTAYSTGRDEDFHEWRKRIKDHWYHTQLIRPAWDTVLAARQGEIKALSDCIGDDHDLAVLRATLEIEQRTFDVGDGATLLNELALHRQAELREQGWALGARIYGEKPGAFRARISSYWQVWRWEA